MLANTDKETDMETKKMSKREIFLSDVIITAVEGGIGYWSLCSEYDCGIDFDTVDENTLDATRKPAKAVILEEEEDKDTKYVVDNKLVAKAFRRIMGKGEIPYTGNEWRERMARAYKDVDDGVCDIDSGDADCIVQIGLFGEVRYG